MVRNYAVTITASQTAIGAAILAERLAQLLGQPVDEVQQAIVAGTVIIQRELSYAEAIEFQRELSRRKIPAQVSTAQVIDGVELLLHRREGSEESGAVEEVEEVQELDRAGSAESEVVVEVEDVEVKSVEKDREEGRIAGNAWADLFPGLDDEVVEDAGGAEEEELLDIPVVMDEDAFELEELDEDWAQAGDEEFLEIGEDQGGDRGFEAELDAAEAKGNEAPQAFDGDVIRQAFVAADEERAPYQPKGYDPRPPHVPLIAAVLSAIAPGAGQVFNGQSKKAQRYGVLFLFLYPWYQAVRQAWDYGELIRTHHAPRPETGVGKKAVKFGAKWWVAVVFLGFFSVWIVTNIQHYQTQQHAQQERKQLQQLIFYSQDLVEDAVFDGEEASRTAKVEVDSEEVMKMEDQERARRVYIVGYHHCVANEYQLCEAAMRRVTSLVQDNRDAFRLQTWASIQAQGADAEMEMPDVGEVPTLEDFELEMTVVGEDVENLEDEWWDKGELNIDRQEGP